MSSLSDEIDEGPTDSPMVGTPPPSAPIPPPPPFSRTAYTSTANGIQQPDMTFQNTDPDSDGQRAYRYACSAVPENLDNFVCISYQRKVEPLIQSGPQCGLVALAMADSILNRDVKLEKLTELSQTQGFSKQGELFSAHYMEQLARLSFGCKTSVLDIRDVGGKWEFLNCLARGDVLLVPYDPDKNYVPVLKKGHKAHWALITGFFAAINDDNAIEKFKIDSVKTDSDIINLHHCKSAPVPSNMSQVLPAEPNMTPRALSASVPMRAQGTPVGNRSISARTLPPDPTQPSNVVTDNTKLSHNVGNLSRMLVSTVNKPGCSWRNPLEAASYILVYAKQGKSKHTGIWNAKTLVESCCNLLEIDPMRLEDRDNYTFPEGGIEEELCGKVVVLHTATE